MGAARRSRRGGPSGWPVRCWPSRLLLAAQALDLRAPLAPGRGSRAARDAVRAGASRRSRPTATSRPTWTPRWRLAEDGSVVIRRRGRDREPRVVVERRVMWQPWTGPGLELAPARGGRRRRARRQRGDRDGRRAGRSPSATQSAATRPGTCVISRSPASRAIDDAGAGQQQRAWGAGPTAAASTLPALDAPPGRGPVGHAVHQHAADPPAGAGPGWATEITVVYVEVPSLRVGRGAPALSLPDVGCPGRELPLTKPPPAISRPTSPWTPTAWSWSIRRSRGRVDGLS